MTEQRGEKEQEVLTPEVLPPEKPSKSKSQRLQKTIGPVVAGLILDFVDLATFGPIGLYAGMILGGGIAWYICSLYDLPWKTRIIWSLIAGIYCTLPFTEFIPLATILGALLRWRE